MEYGIINESVAINHFCNKTGLTVEQSGLWIDSEHNFLAASPDGLVGDRCLVEVKCLYSLRNSRAGTFTEALKEGKVKFLENKGGVLSLRKTHNYFYQIQGQLNITDRDKCYFIIYINDNIDVFIQEIDRDKKFWEEKMLPQLVKFYKDCILVEIVLNNLGKNKKCRDPAYILNAIEEKRNAEKKREKL